MKKVVIITAEKFEVDFFVTAADARKSVAHALAIYNLSEKKEAG